MVPVKRFLAAAAVCVMLGGCASAGPENRETPGLSPPQNRYPLQSR